MSSRSPNGDQALGPSLAAFPRLIAGSRIGSGAALVPVWDVGAQVVALAVSSQC